MGNSCGSHLIPCPPPQLVGDGTLSTLAGINLRRKQVSAKAEKKEQFAWGHKIPLPLGFSSPEALYPKIDLNLSKGPFWGLAVHSPGPDQEPLQVAVMSTQKG